MRLIGRASITRRLTLLFVIASSSVLLALGFVIAGAVEEHFEQQDMEILTRQMSLTGHSLDKLGPQQDLTQIPLVLDMAMVGHHGPEVLVVGPAGNQIFATANALFPPERVREDALHRPYRPSLWAVGGQTYRGIAARLPIGQPSNGVERRMASIMVAIDIAHHQAFMASFRQTLWAFVLGAAVLSSLLGWAVARRGLAPLRAMREQAEVVTASQLGHRLAVDSVPVELAELAQTLNDMLSRLEDAFRRLSDFSSDIAHELRTPVSNLMTQTQVALSRPRTAEDYRQILESNAEELEHMAMMISDMLLLAKASNGLAVMQCEEVDVVAELRELFDFFDAVAEANRLQLALSGRGTLHADKGMLRRAMSNLLSNALRHAAPNTTVSVSVESTAAQVRICVQDAGDTIPPEFLERVFDRFFRIDASRQGGDEGTGLGLAITQSIVLAHGGSIDAASDSGVTRFTLRLPRRPATH